jgi:hypothetical protein
MSAAEQQSLTPQPSAVTSNCSGLPGRCRIGSWSTMDAFGADPESAPKSGSGQKWWMRRKTLLPGR